MVADVVSTTMVLLFQIYSSFELHNAALHAVIHDLKKLFPFNFLVVLKTSFRSIVVYIVVADLITFAEDGCQQQKQTPSPV